MAYTDDANLGEAERVLLAMHNLSLVRPEIAWSGREIARGASISEDSIQPLLRELEATGYVKSYSDQNGVRRFYLSSKGIIKTSAFFT